MNILLKISSVATNKFTDFKFHAIVLCAQYSNNDKQTKFSVSAMILVYFISFCPYPAF